MKKLFFLERLKLLKYPNQIYLGEDLWAVDFLFGKKYDPVNKHLCYKVKWKDYDYKSSTWEPTSHLIEIPDLVVNFERFLSRNIFRKKLLNSSPHSPSPSIQSKDIPTVSKKPRDSKSLNKDKNDEKEMDFDFDEDFDNNADNPNKSQKNILINSEITENGMARAKKKVKMTHLITLNLDKKEDTELFGRIENDIPEKIINHNLEDPENMVKKDKKTCQQHIKRFHYKLQWMKRENGILPIPTYYSFEIIKKYYPQLLLDYFEDNETLIDVKKEKK